MLIYDSPGFWSKIKEKGSVAKEAWGVIGSALSVQQVMQDMERLASKGEVDEEELKAMELDMTGKIMLASWRGTRFEVVQVLREVSMRLYQLRDSFFLTSYQGCRQCAQGAWRIATGSSKSCEGSTADGRCVQEHSAR